MCFMCVKVYMYLGCIPRTCKSVMLQHANAEEMYRACIWDVLEGHVKSMHM